MPTPAKTEGDLMNYAEFGPASAQIQRYVGHWWPGGATSPTPRVREESSPGCIGTDGSASGPLIYVAARSSQAADVARYAARLATELAWSVSTPDR